MTSFCKACGHSGYYVKTEFRHFLNGTNLCPPAWAYGGRA